MDPVNQALSEYRGLQVSSLNLLKEGSVDQREFDLLMERFLTVLSNGYAHLEAIGVRSLVKLFGSICDYPSIHG